MRIVLFYHSLLSDLNNSPAHALRGLSMELLLRGHEVVVYEPRASRSLRRLLSEHGHEPVARFHAAYPGLASRRYDAQTLDLDAATAGADVVVVHQWTDPQLTRAIGLHRVLTGGYRLFFHATHPALPGRIERCDLRHYDGVLAASTRLREHYLSQSRAARAWLWPEAADTRLFKPSAAEPAGDVVWVGNWQAGERAATLRELLLGPVRALGLRARVYGAGYTPEALAALATAGVEYGGWVPNFELPRLLAGFKVALHLPTPAAPAPAGGRLFQALACERPLVSAPWDDQDGLFEPGADYALARDGAEMTRWLQTLLANPAQAQALAHHGRASVLRAHTCAHRADELLALSAPAFSLPGQRPELPVLL